MKSEIKVSVIIPTYHDWDRLSLCLRALDEQTYPKEKLEIIVVNNDPEDPVPIDYLIPDQCIVISENKPGSYAARNAGIAKARGEILAFTDSDCIPDKDWLVSGVACLVGSEKVGVVAGRIELFYNSKNPNAVEIYEKYTAFNQKNNAKAGSCVGANWFSFKKVITEFGGFNSKLKSGGDSDLSVKICKYGYSINYCSEAVILHPSRSSYSELGIKYRRVFGGRFDKTTKNKLLFTIDFISKFIFNRSRFSIKKFFQVSLSESVSILQVNLYLYLILFAEAIKLNLGYESQRR